MKINYYNISSFVLIFFVLFLPCLVLAAPLVPCGTSEVGSQPCTFGNLADLFNRVMDFLLRVVLIPLAVMAIVFVGIQYVTAAGNPAKLSKAHEVLWDVLLGILIALAAWAIINTIFNVLTNFGGLPSITGK